MCGYVLVGSCRGKPKYHATEFREVWSSTRKNLPAVVGHDPLGLVHRSTYIIHTQIPSRFGPERTDLGGMHKRIRVEMTEGPTGARMLIHPFPKTNHVRRLPGVSKASLTECDTAEISCSRNSCQHTTTELVDKLAPRIQRGGTGRGICSGCQGRKTWASRRRRTQAPGTRACG